jgi:hypothetical protein
MPDKRDQSALNSALAVFSPYYNPGGTLAIDHPTYVVRDADAALQRSVLSGRICTVLSARQLGKSSLLTRVHHNLPAGTRVVYVDLQINIQHEINVLSFYIALCADIKATLPVRLDLEDFFENRGSLTVERRFFDFLTIHVLELLGDQRLIVEFDEIERLIGLPFADDFFAILRAVFNAGANAPKLRQIAFVLAGAVPPNALMSDSLRSPFNVADEIEISDLPRSGAEAHLALGLPFPHDLQRRAFDRIWYWTDGHPYLTQRVCAALAAQDWGSGSEVDLYVDATVKRFFVEEDAEDGYTIPHMKKLIDSFDAAKRKQVVSLYADVYSGIGYSGKQGDPALAWLLMTGLVRRGVAGQLEVRNRIFRAVFHDGWIRQQLPRWTVSLAAEQRRSRATKHTILFLAANPGGTDQRALDEEARTIQVELKRSGFNDSFELVTRWAVEPLDLLREIRTLKPSVVHFSRHGTSDAAGARLVAGRAHRDITDEDSSEDPTHHGVYFQGPEARPQLVSVEAFAQAFGAASSSVRLVILSACYSEAQAAALIAHVDCVVGMRGSIDDDAARSFAIGFYGGLAERESVAAAYRQGCAAIRLQGLPDGDLPQLRVRDGVDANLVVLADLMSGDLASSDLTPRSRGSRLPPTPAYLNAEVQALSERLASARARKQSLRDVGIATNEVDREILELRRMLREGGQLRAGDVLGDGRYLLVKPVGRGGFAVVWEAWDSAERRRVAIKVLHPHLASDPQRRERFFRGARVMMDLRHPAVVRVLDPQGEDESFCYFVMELVPGGNLREVVLSNRVETGHRLSLILQVGEVLAEAHRKQLVHRDIKPGNILVDEDGNAKLTDFDLVGAHDTTGGTRTGAALGTVVYAAPECLERPQDATARADVYGLGMTAIFALAGKELSFSTFRNPELTIVGLACSTDVQDALRRAVAWEPEQRFADAGAMVEALRGAMGVSSPSASAEETTQPVVTALRSPRRMRVSRRWVLPVALLIVIASLVVAAALYGVVR